MSNLTGSMESRAVTYGEDNIKNIFLASGKMGSDKATPNVHDKKAMTPPIGDILQGLRTRA